MNASSGIPPAQGTSPPSVTLPVGSAGNVVVSSGMSSSPVGGMTSSSLGGGVSGYSPSASPSGKRSSSSLQGPCFLKMLVSNLVAGSVIGKSGTVIGRIEKSTGAAMKLSPTNTFFPGTSDRIVVMSGEQDQVDSALSVIVEKISDATASQSPENSMGVRREEVTCKIVVPKSAVSGIIGKQGMQIKQLQENSGAKVQVSQRESGLNERVVTISGTLSSTHSAACQIAKMIQEDSHLKDNMHVVYNVASPGGMGGSGLSFGGYVPYGSIANGGFGFPYAQNSPLAMAGVPDAPVEIMMELCEIFLEIPDTSIGPIIGKGGVHLSDIIRSTGAAVKLSQKGDYVPGTQKRKVSISGTLRSVQSAHLRLLLRLRESSAYPAASHAGAQAAGSPISAKGSSPIYGRPSSVGGGALVGVGGRMGSTSSPHHSGATVMSPHNVQQSLHSHGAGSYHSHHHPHFESSGTGAVLGAAQPVQQPMPGALNFHAYAY